MHDGGNQTQDQKPASALNEGIASNLTKQQHPVQNEWASLLKGSVCRIAIAVGIRDKETDLVRPYLTKPFSKCVNKQANQTTDKCAINTDILEVFAYLKLQLSAQLTPLPVAHCVANKRGHLCAIAQNVAIRGMTYPSIYLLL